ncbi:hypothetical protein [Streptomyces sp. NBC_01618]|uniref:hypothetical protein n=1 Tax=Streptomyces sp. NBC_01618 TaxID=2975900 RepID=UPI0038678ACD|nr:hypothetical protein OH735_20360 [Streptomyces sp. NBC_01618]
MRSTAIRRTAVAAAAVSLALLAAGCGGSDSDSGSGGKGADAKGKESAAAKPAAKALTAAELEKVALTQGDVKGHKIGKAAAKDVVPVDGIKVEKEVCAPLAHALMGAEVGEPGAFTKRTVVSEPKKGSMDKGDADPEEAFKTAFDITTTQLALGSYDGKGAEESVTSLRTAATECAGGFDFTAAGEKQRVSKITEEQVKGGEEAVAWTVQLEQGGEKVQLKLVGLRQGPTFASFSSMNLAAMGGGGDFELPTAVVEAQAAKLA